MIPKDPSPKDTEGIEASPKMFLQFPLGLLPPNSKRGSPGGC